MVRIFFLIIFSTVSTLCYSGTIHPEAEDKHHLDYGSKFSHTIVVLGKSKDSKSYMGSGVIIKPNYAITAAHVIHNAENCFIIVGSKAVMISDIITHKDFKFDEYGKYDIAILKLSSRVDFDWYSPLYTKDDEVGKIVSISGFGATGDFKKGRLDESDLKKRGGSNEIDRIQDHLLVTSASDKDRTSLEFLIAVGDSGGPLYINNKLAGIHSCVMSNDGASDSSYTDEGGHTRISIFADWIKENTKD